MKIVQIQAPYSPQEGDANERPRMLIRRSDVKPGLESDYETYLSVSAMDTIHAHVNWGTQSYVGLAEQGGILVGQAFREPSGHGYSLVTRAIAGALGDGSMTYLKMGHSCWHQMLSELDTLREASPNETLEIMGWYHTHPGNLGVFMSGTDMRTQQLLFPSDWHVALVMNPQKQLWRVYQGYEAKLHQGWIYKSESSPLDTEDHVVY